MNEEQINETVTMDSAGQEQTATEVRETEQTEVVETQQAESETSKTETKTVEEKGSEQIPPENADNQKKLSGKKWGIIGGIAVVLIALIVGINIYNTPANRLARQLDLGNRYLEEQQYAEAIVAFEKAISIDDRCLEAYVGGIAAYQGLDDAEGLTALYEKALAAVERTEESELAESIDAVVAIYLAADEVYNDNLEKVIEILEAGLVKTGNNAQVKERLVMGYLDLAGRYVGDADYERALEVYDRLLELDEENEQVQSDVGSCLQVYLDLLIDQGRYDEARALIAKYRDKVNTVDFQEILDRIAELERIEAENTAFMQKIYDLMAAEDYEAMHGVDGSEEARAFVSKMEGDSYVYLPVGNSSRTGTGSGVYKFGEGGYYFYYGNFADGSREGTGLSFCNNSVGGYAVFSGQWQNDAPNGPGENRISYAQFTNSGGGYTEIESGNLINGLWDGPIDDKIIYANATFNVSFTAVNGIPQEDKTSEFHNAFGGWTDIEEGSIIYAYDRVGYDWVWSYYHPEQPLGVAGYGTD